MNTKKELTLRDFRGCIPTILQYQLLSKFLLIVILKVHSGLVGLLLWNLGRPAFTSGDLPYLLRSWQGWGLLLMGVLILWLYTVFDINVMINICERILKNRKYNLADILVETFYESLKFFSPMGIAVLIFTGVLAPLCGAAFGISLTSSLVIPEFILSVIYDNPVFHVLYVIVLIVLLGAAYFGIFTFHGVLMSHENVFASYKHSVRLIRGHFLDFLKRYIIMFFRIGIAYLGGLAVFYVLPIVLVYVIPVSAYLKHMIIISASLLMMLFSLVFIVLSNFAMILKLTMTYEEYLSGVKQEYVVPERKRKIRYFVASSAVLAGILLVGALLALDFDNVFPKVADTETVAHRACGNMANENTVLGMESAIGIGAEYAEIDVQRTRDGYYIINHDNDFKRVTGNEHKPGELTLEEIKQLSVVNSADPSQPSAEVATIEEFLDSSKDRIGLLVELKGVSADNQMVDDLIEMIEARNMKDQVILISLDYGVLEYAKKTCPEIRTGYLCYYGFGDIGGMNCDFLLLEAETATPQNIDRIHAEGKKVGVWTVNTTDAIVRFYNSEVDFIITDKVREAIQMRTLITSERDEVRVANFLNLK